MVRLKSVLKWAFLVLVLLFIYLPIMLLTFFSFGEGDTIQSNLQEFKPSLTHYKYFFNINNFGFNHLIFTSFKKFFYIYLFGILFLLIIS